MDLGVARDDPDELADAIRRATEAARTFWSRPAECPRGIRTI